MRLNKKIFMGFMTIMMVMTASVAAFADETQENVCMDVSEGGGASETDTVTETGDGSSAAVQNESGSADASIQEGGTASEAIETAAAAAHDPAEYMLLATKAQEEAALLETKAKEAEAAANALATTGRPDIVNFARQYIGVLPYGTGNSLSGRADCSGFVQAVFREFGMYLPRSSREQAAAAPRYVSEAEMLPGDLIFYGRSIGSVSHVAIYTGDNSIVHATNSRRGSVFEDRGGSAIHYETIAAIGRYW